MPRPKVGLALGSGATRGLAHIGVIQALKENDIPIDYVSGTSIGALIGALFCSGADLEGITKILNVINTKHILDFSASRKGLLQGKRIEELLRIFIKKKTFEELEIPFAAVATELVKGEKVIFDSGDIVKAVRASMSIPGIFTPVEDEGKIYVDGGVFDRVPGDVAISMGADVVIGVDVGYRHDDDFIPKNMMDVIIKSMGIMELQLLKNNVKKCDVLICPDVGHLKPYSLDNIDECVKGGMDVTLNRINIIKDIILHKAANL